MANRESTVYLDNNATTRVAPEVIEAMMPFFGDRYGNPSSIYRFGGTVRRHIERAREQVAALIGASPGEIVFTSCGSEGDNMALKGFFQERGERTRIVTTAVEHPAVRNTARFLSGRGAKITELSVDNNGMLSGGVFDSIDISRDTLTSIMWANNETGVVFPIRELAGAVKARGGLFHTDAVQAAGKTVIDVKKVPVDMLAFSGHKLHAPKGVGAAYFRAGTPVKAILHGGHQEGGVRAGTENVPYIVGLGRACELAAQRISEENTRVRTLRDRLEKALLEKCAGAKLNGHPTERLPNTTNVSFENIEGEAILLHLDEAGIAASSGSACTTGSLEPSHVMTAMGIPYNYAHSSIRFSFSVYSTDEDVDRVIAVMPDIVEKLRRLSPFVDQVF
ncbi:MAG: cysteine desulfurase NifS [Chitinispirillales bacterium]|jgi:cysteine desulfurase|nr:cysteine desulfurase NifS [Chitinispirillales bacterium]